MIRKSIIGTPFILRQLMEKCLTRECGYEEMIWWFLKIREFYLDRPMHLRTCEIEQELASYFLGGMSSDFLITITFSVNIEPSYSCTY